MIVILNILLILSAVQVVLSSGIYAAALAGHDISHILPMYYAVLLLLVLVPGVFFCQRRFGFEESFRASPRWLKILTCILFIIAIVNFTVTLVLLEGGGPRQRADGAYALMRHGRLIRTLTAEEYRRYLAYDALLFSGHLVFFSTGILTILVGAKCRARGLASGEYAETARPAEPVGESHLPIQATPLERPPNRSIAFAAFIAILAFLFLIFSWRFETGAAAALLAMVLGLFNVKRHWPQWKVQQPGPETFLGCLAMFISVILAMHLTWRLQWFIYVVFACGLHEAMTGGITVLPSEPSRLSNGELVNHRLLTMISLIVWPFMPLVFAGLLHPLEILSRYFRNHTKSS
jgi:hypothetical protein